MLVKNKCSILACKMHTEYGPIFHKKTYFQIFHIHFLFDDEIFCRPIILNSVAFCYQNEASVENSLQEIFRIIANCPTKTDWFFCGEKLSMRLIEMSKIFLQWPVKKCSTCPKKRNTPALILMAVGLVVFLSTSIIRSVEGKGNGQEQKSNKPRPKASS